MRLPKVPAAPRDQYRVSAKFTVELTEEEYFTIRAMLNHTELFDAPPHLHFQFNQYRPTKRDEEYWSYFPGKVRETE